MRQIEMLEITTTDTEGMTIVAVRGDIDLSNSVQVKNAIEAKCSSVIPSVMALDMRETPFIDSAGLALIVQMKKHLAPDCVLSLVIERGSQPDRVLRLGRFDSFLPVKYALEDVAHHGTV